MESNHVFVRAPSESVLRAWEEFTGSGIDDGVPHVAVIPADGGCFVVARGERGSAGALAPWRRLGKRGPRVSRRQLEHFRDRVERDRGAKQSSPRQ